MNARLAAVLQAGQNATSTGNIKDLSKKKDKPPPGANNGQLGPPLVTPQAKIAAPPKAPPKPQAKAVTAPAAIKVAPPAKGKMSYAQWIQDDIEKYEANRAKDLQKVVDAIAVARACRQKVEDINAAEQAESAKDAKLLISDLAAALTKKGAEYDVVQKQLDDVAKSGDEKTKATEAAAAAMAAEMMERQGEKARLENDLKECTAKAVAKVELAKATWEKMEASMQSNMKLAEVEHDKLVLALRKQIKDLTDTNTKCGDEEKAKIDTMQKESREAADKYEKLHEKVCDMLKSFKVPSSTTEV